MRLPSGDQSGYAANIASLVRRRRLFAPEATSNVAMTEAATVVVSTPVSGYRSSSTTIERPSGDQRG
jgi:hypothetical protein